MPGSPNPRLPVCTCAPGGAAEGVAAVGQGWAPPQIPGSCSRGRPQRWWTAYPKWGYSFQQCLCHCEGISLEQAGLPPTQSTDTVTCAEWQLESSLVAVATEGMPARNGVPREPDKQAASGLGLPGVLAVLFVYSRFLPGVVSGTRPAAARRGRGAPRGHRPGRRLLLPSARPRSAKTRLDSRAGGGRFGPEPGRPPGAGQPGGTSAAAERSVLKLTF